MSYVKHTTITDRYSVVLNINSTSNNRNNKPNPKFINKINQATFSEHLSKHNWDTVINETDVNKSAYNFIQELNNLLKMSSKIKISSKTYRIKRWATTKIILSIRHRDHLHIYVRKHPENIMLKEFYNKFRNKVTKTIREAKNSYYKIELLKAY